MLVRFGKVMSIVTCKAIEPHNEIFVNYNYRVWQAPPWYQEQWIQFKRDVEHVSEENLLELTRRFNRDYGVNVEFVAPRKTSKRYLSCGRCQSHVSVTQPSICCEMCEKWYHVACTNVCLESIRNLHHSGTEQEWTCPSCQVVQDR